MKSTNICISDHAVALRSCTGTATDILLTRYSIPVLR